MSQIISDVVKNYESLLNILSDRFSEVNGYKFYKSIFPRNENKGEMNTDYSKPNAIYMYKDERDEGTKRTVRRRIMLNDTWENDYKTFVENNPLTFCSGLSYRGRVNRLENAQQLHALIFDLDSVTENELNNLLLRIGKPVGIRTLPQPTYIVMSGTGLHIYYVLDEPIDLFPNIKLQMKQLKYDLTFRLWEYKGTSLEKQIQYQGINQGFRMVGSTNAKYKLKIRAFKTGERISINTLNEYVIKDENKVDLGQLFKPSKYTREEAKEKFPDWYERVIIQGNKMPNKWHIKRDLYDWWLRQAPQIKGGHRYFFLMCMSIYAVKCDIPKDELKKDMYSIFEELSKIEHSHNLVESDIVSALEAYDRSYYNFTISDIEKLTDIRIERNKRNYRSRDQHLERARAVQNIDYPNGVWRGNQSKEKEVTSFIKNNPDLSVTQIAKELNVSRPTVYKYLKKINE